VTKAREAPVFVVSPPRVLLMDVAGPIEVLRKANLEQDKIRFVVRFVGPTARVSSSIGLDIAGVEPLPESLPDGALVVIAGSAAIPMGAYSQTAPEDEDQKAAIRDWLRVVIRPGVRLATICSGALLAGQAGLLDGYECTTHHATCDALKRIAPAARVL